jgi:hypothetical protein
VTVLNNEGACVVVVGGEVDSYTIRRGSREGETPRDSNAVAEGVSSPRREESNDAWPNEATWAGLRRPVAGTQQGEMQRGSRVLNFGGGGMVEKFAAWRRRWLFEGDGGVMGREKWGPVLLPCEGQG